MWHGWNIYVLIGLIIRSLAIMYMAFYIGTRQYLEVKAPLDPQFAWLRGLRILILTTIIFVVGTATPSVAYQFTQLHEAYPDMLRSVSAITGNLSYAGLAVLFGLIYNYKRRK